MSMRLQYLGFAVVAGGREYSYRLLGGADADRSCTVSIANALFLRGRLKYQEGPDISYRKLLAALAVEETDSAFSLSQRITDTEVTDYIGAVHVHSRLWTEQQRRAARQRSSARIHL